MESEFENYLLAKPYERTDQRKGYHNGSYPRKLKTRVGTIELDVVRDREGNFSTELFRRYQRSEQAFVSSMVEMYLQGVSTRKVRHIVEELCGTNVSKRTVSNFTKSLEENVTRWRKRELKGNYPYLVIDARYEDVRENGAVVSKAVLIVIGIKESGKREILAVEMGNSEDEQEWSRVFKELKSRGLRGVIYAVSDAHKGLVAALKREFQSASCRDAKYILCVIL